MALQLNLSYQMVYRIPLAGWLIRDAVRGQPDAKYYFIANVAVLLLGLVWLFGYPLVICLALGMAAVALSGLVVLTAGDAFERSPTTARNAVATRQSRNRALRKDLEKRR